jgi:dynein heavy chain 1
LWEIDAKTQIYDKIGEDIQKWQRLMNAIKEGRKKFDNSEIEKFFGPIQIIYSLV